MTHLDTTNEYKVTLFLYLYKRYQKKIVGTYVGAFNTIRNKEDQDLSRWMSLQPTTF